MTFTHKSTGTGLPPELVYTGRLSAALRHGRMMKQCGANEKDIAKAIMRKLKQSGGTSNGKI